MLDLKIRGQTKNAPAIALLAIFTASLACNALAPTPPADPSRPSSEITYASVEEALADLSGKEGVEINRSEGWTIVMEDHDASITMWSFAPQQHPAYPSVAKRVFWEDEETWYVEMSILCEASQPACEQFNQDFVHLNDEMRKYILKDQLRQFLAGSQ